MSDNIKVFEYEGNPITFEFTNNEKFVNATEMAKTFDKKLNVFFRQKQTAEFINVLFNSLNINRDDNSRLEKIRSLNTENLAKAYPELIKVVRGGDPKMQGTWVHERLSLKLAAWLSPHFELWVFDTVMELLIEGHVHLKNKENLDLEWHLDKITNNVDDIRNLLDTIPGQKDQHKRLKDK